MILLLWFVSIQAQSLEELHTRKQKAVEELNYTNELLQKTQKNEKASLNRLILLNNKISERNKIISALKSEADVIQRFIDDNTWVVSWMQDDLDALKKEYAAMIRFAWKNRAIQDEIIFLLSAHDFNEAYKRHLYLKQYAAYREKQAQTIQSLQKILAEKVIALKKQKEEKGSLLQEAENENNQLLAEKTQQNLYVRKLQQQQKTLRQKIIEQQKAEQELEKKIQQVLEEEARKLKKEGKPEFALTPEQKLIGDKFEQNKSRLPWPVERGVITEHFGLQQHPTLKNITINNNGIDISTEPGAKARVVFNGEVTRVFAISGGNMAVIIRHGRYLTVYSNLSEVYVKAGNNVTTKQDIGTIFTDPEEAGKTILKFQVWYENQKLNPEDWIVKQ